MLSLDVREKTLHVISLLESGPVNANGRLMTLTQACLECGISYAQFRNAVKGDDTLGEMYQNALAMCEDIMADMLINIDEQYSDPKMAAVISKNIHWLLARRRRADYGDHMTVEHTTTRDQELLKRMKEAKARALEEKPAPTLIDGEIVTSGEDASPTSIPVPPALSAPRPVPISSDPEQRAALRALGLLP